MANRLRASIIALFFFSLALYADDWSAWTHHQSLRFDTRQVLDTVFNFPMLIRLNPGNFSAFSQVLPGGADIRFSKAGTTGAALPYEIERWVDGPGNNDTAEIWVKIDTVWGNFTSQSINILWGNSGATSQSNPQAVFPTSAGYAGVWHMNESPTAPGSIKDRTANGYNASPVGMNAASSVPGVIGKALNFNGSSYDSLPSIATNFTHGITIACWVNYAALNNNSRLVDFGTSTFGSNNIYFGNSGTTSSAQFDLYNSSPTWHFSDTVTNTFTLNQWAHVCATFDSAGDVMQILKNGTAGTAKFTPDGSGGAAAAIGNVTRTLNYIGKSNKSGDPLFSGLIDEVQVIATLPGSNFAKHLPFWAKLSYLSQLPNQTIVCDSPVINTQPTPWGGFPGDTLGGGTNNPNAFSVTAIGFNLHYLWQRRDSVSPANPGTWANAPGSSDTLPDYRYFPASTGDSIAKFRCIVSSGPFSDTTIVVKAGICIHTSVAPGTPGDQQGFVGDTARFQVTMNTGKNLTHHWLKAHGTTNWTSAPGAGNSASYAFKVDSTDSNSHFRDSVTGSCFNNWDTSRTAGISLLYHVVIDSQPQNLLATAGQTATFRVKARGKNLHFLWQKLAPPATDTNAWAILSDTNPVYSFTALSSDSGAKFRCQIFSSDENKTTASAILSVCTPPSISVQPQFANATIGTVATDSVTASGTGLSYKWQKNNVNIDDAAGHYSGTATRILAITVQPSDTGNSVQFRCQITGSCGTLNSQSFSITGCSPAQIVTNPQNTSVVSGQTAAFTIGVTGTHLTYQWQNDSLSIGTAFANIPGATLPALSFPAQDGHNGVHYRCIVTGDYCTPGPNHQDTSTAALLTVCIPASITRQPHDTTIMGGDSAYFSLTARGTGLQYQWYKKSGQASWQFMLGLTKASIKVATDTVDTNAHYHCVVTGTCGSVTSDSVKACLAWAPQIDPTTPKSATNICVGSQARFSVAAKGVTPLSFLWQFSSTGSDPWTSDNTNGKDSVYIYAVGSPDVNNYSFRCIVTSSSCRAISLASNPAKLIVGLAPTISQQPVNASAIEGQTATFTVNASGTGLTYQWQRKDTTAAWTNIPLANGSSYNLSSKLSDNGASFRCVLTGTCGAITSNAATATVYRKAKANFGINPSNGQADSAHPIQITFTDSSIGTLSLWKLSYGDGTKDSITSGNFVRTHSYTIPGAYTIKLVVSGLSGIDSVTKTLNIYPTGGNPIFMTGKYKSKDSVILTFTNYAALSDAPPAAPYVSSIKLWVMSGKIPQTIDALLGNCDSVPPRILLSAIKARGSTFVDTVKVPIALNSNDSAVGFGFMSQIIWNDNTTTPFNNANGTTVVMHAPAPPNNLALSAAYSRLDTVTFFIDSTQKIDPVLSDSVGLWFGLGGDSIPNFVSSSNLQWWSAATVTGRASANRFIDTLKNSQFNTDSKILHAALAIKGKNKLLSAIVKTSLQIGGVRPINHMSLYAQPLDGTTIRLSWTGITPSDSIEKIRFYYTTVLPVPLDYQFTGLDSILADPAATSDTVYYLNTKTRYYFGGQVYRQGLWSYVTDSSNGIPGSRATASTPSDTGTPPPNHITFGSAQFDTSNNQIKITWSVNTTGYTNPQVGIACIPVATASDPLPDGSMTSTILKTVGVTTPNGSYNLDLADSLLFDTTYHVYLWLKSASRPWATPVAASSGTCRVPAFGWQRVHYSINVSTSGPDDTTYWVNRKIRFDVPFVTTSTLAGHYAATINSYDMSTSYNSGFIVVGQPFLFTTVTQTAAFYIGMKCTIPAGFNLQDAKVYRLNAITGRWQVQRGTTYDAVNSYAVISTGSDFYSPFAVMIDTQPPTITLLSDTAAPLLNGRPLYDTLLIKDNAGNFTWKFRCRTGDHPFTDAIYADSSTGGSSNGIDTAKVAVSKAAMLTSESGILAYLSVEDSRYTVLKDLSPRIVHDNSVPIYITHPLIWTPFYVNTVLDIPGAKQILHFLDTAAANPRYDNTMMRLYRYINNGWKEYAGDADTAFDLKAGKLLWIKARNELAITLGRNAELSLFDTVTIPLTPNGWTDIALPFKFDMKLGDILRATRSGSPLADSLRYYAWRRVNDTGNYFCTPAFNPKTGIDSLADSTKQLSHLVSGFSVYNNSNQTFNLRIPPIPNLLSDFSTQSPHKLAASTGWAVLVAAKTADGATLSPVYCGYNPSNGSTASYYPIPPSFEPVSVGVCEEQSGALNGIKVEHSMHGGGCSYLLSFKNDVKDKQNIAFHLERTAGVSSQMKTVIFNPLTGEATEVTSNEVSMPVDGQSSVYRVLLVGDANFIRAATGRTLSANVALEKVYPNPLRGVVHLRYFMPMANVGSRVEFRIMDISGRTIWSKSIKEQEFWGGSRECLWDATTGNHLRASSGLYIVQMSALDAKGRKLSTFERKLTILPQ